MRVILMVALCTVLLALSPVYGQFFPPPFMLPPTPPAAPAQTLPNPAPAPGATPPKAAASQPSMKAQPTRSAVERFVEALLPGSVIDPSEEKPGAEFYNKCLNLIAERHLLLTEPDLRKAWLEKWQKKFKGSKQLDTPEGVDEAVPQALADVREMFKVKLNERLAKQAPSPQGLPVTNLSAHARSADDPQLLELLLLQLQWFDKYVAPAKRDPSLQAREHTPVGLALQLKDVQSLLKEHEKATPREWMTKFMVVSPKHQAMIKHVLEGGPAEAAGVKEGELLLEVDGKPVDGKLLRDVAGLLAEGKEGSTVEVTLSSGDPAVTRKVVITRKQFTAKVVHFKDLGQKVAYIGVDEFNESLTSQYEEALKKVVDGGYSMLAIDMRDNGGGLVTAAKSLIEYTMASGYVVTEQHREGDKLERRALYLTREAKLVTNPAIVQGQIEAHVSPRKLLLPESVLVVVLTNGDTASSAELFTLALKANRRGETVGEPTFGKGIEQAVMQLNGRELRVTTAYFEPGDEWTNGLPIQPNILVKADPEKGDVQLQAAIKRLLELQDEGVQARLKTKDALQKQQDAWSKVKR